MKASKAFWIAGLAVVVSQSVVACSDDDAGDDLGFGGSAGVAGSSTDTGATGGVPGTEGGSGGAAGSPEECARGQGKCDGKCVTLANDPDHCGSCGNTCAPDEVCSAGGCRLDCVGGTTACDGSCVDTELDPENCGDCGEVCDAGLVCSRGSCESSCAEGLTWCDGGDDGPARCVDTLRDRYNCGECGNACDEGYVCSNGTCALSCQAGLIDCDGVCIDPKKDRDYCGATFGCGVDGGSPGQACASGEVCSAGTCAVSCQSGFVECDGLCIDPLRDNDYCGATEGCADPGTDCPPGTVCNAGMCSVSCPDGLVKCGDTCVDPLTSREHCGATDGCGEDGHGSAGTTCAAGQVCSSGACVVSCQNGLIECGGTCVNPETDRNHCGASEGCGVDGHGSAGKVCDPGYVCNGGTCSLSCPSNLVNCNGTCIDPLTNPRHCGATQGCGVTGGSGGQACLAGWVCNSGTCLQFCAPGFVSCGGQCIDPTTNRSFCGATPGCGNSGGSPGVPCGPGYVCSQGACVLSCPQGLIQCGNTCIDPKKDRDHCGATPGCGQGGLGSSGAVCAWDQLCDNGVCKKPTPP